MRRFRDFIEDTFYFIVDNFAEIFLTVLMLCLFGVVGYLIIDTVNDKQEWRPVSGQVDWVQRATLFRNDVFMLKLQDDPNVYQCVDVRCSVLMPSEHVWLTCYTQKEEIASDRLVCEFIKSEDVPMPTTD